MTLMTLADIAAPSRAEFDCIPIGETAQCGNLGTSKLRLLRRYFRLETAAVHPDALLAMQLGPLRALIGRHPGLAAEPGLLVHTRTQSHAVLPDMDWLGALAGRAGLRGWESLAITQAHCAGGFAALDRLRIVAGTRPIILLAGEKCLHAKTVSQAGAILGEMPVAVLLRPGMTAPGWCIRATRLRHLPRFCDSPERMADVLRIEWERNFGDYLLAFLTEFLVDLDLPATGFDAIVPYNLNLPLLDRIAARYGRQGRLFTGTVGDVGHLFCADVFYNLAELLPQTGARRILAFAAGMGASFGAMVLEKVPDRDSGRPETGSWSPNGAAGPILSA